LQLKFSSRFTFDCFELHKFLLLLSLVSFSTGINEGGPVDCVVLCGIGHKLRALAVALHFMV
jgi:hypothetical protein